MSAKGKGKGKGKVGEHVDSLALTASGGHHPASSPSPPSTHFPPSFATASISEGIFPNNPFEVSVEERCAINLCVSLPELDGERHDCGYSFSVTFRPLVEDVNEQSMVVFDGRSNPWVVIRCASPPLSPYHFRHLLLLLFSHNIFSLVAIQPHGRLSSSTPRSVP